MIRRPPRSTRTDTLFPYTSLFRSDRPPRALNKCASRSVEEIAFDPGGWEFPVDDLSRRQRSSHDSRNVAAHPAIYSRAIREPCDGGSDPRRRALFHPVREIGRAHV